MTRCKCGKIVPYTRPSQSSAFYQLLLLKLTSWGLLIETNEIAFYLREIFRDKLSNWTRASQTSRSIKNSQHNLLALVQPI
jgi:hypothetical protein